MILTARQTVPAAQVLVHHLLSQSQKALQIDTHFTDAETDSTPAQRSLFSIQAPLPATPHPWECSLGQPCGTGCKLGIEWDPGRKPQESPIVKSELSAATFSLQTEGDSQNPTGIRHCRVSG